MAAAPRPMASCTGTARPANCTTRVRAVTQPYPGAFSFAGDRKLTVWKSHWLAQQSDKQPGTILSQEPLRIACGEGVLEIVAGQAEGGSMCAAPSWPANWGWSKG